MRQQGRDYLAYLDGIRGGAALYVLLAHCMIWGGWTYWLLPDPKVAVDIFMIMSGFLMAYHAQLRESREPMGTWNTTWKFWMRRFFRIAPAYYLSLLIAFALGARFIDGYVTLQQVNPEYWAGTIYHPQLTAYTPLNFILHASFLFGLIPQYAYSTLLPDWSLGLEMQFYAVFPLLLWWFRKQQHMFPALLLMTGCTYIVWLFREVPGGVFPEPSFLPLKLILFMAGMVVAEAAAAPAHRRLPLVVLALTLAGAQFAFGGHPLVFIVVITLIGLAVGGVFADRPTRWIATILGNRVTNFLADTSYSVYLFHGFFISLGGSYLFAQPWFFSLKPSIRVLVLMLAVGACTYATARLVSLAVEKPSVGAGRQIIRWLSGKPDSPRLDGAVGNPVATTPGAG